MGRYPLTITVLVLGAAACRPPQADEAATLGPVVELRLPCRPTTLADGDTLVVTLSERLVNAEMSIEAPDGTFFQLVAEHPTTEHGPQLMTSTALRSSSRLRLAVASLRGLPYVYRATETQRVFSAAGEYRIRVAERLNTDDGTPLSTCTVRYGARQPD